VDNIDFNALTDKIGELTRLTIKQERALIRQAGKIRGYKKSIRKYKEEIESLKKAKSHNKQHYKNGRRGTKFNG